VLMVPTTVMPTPPVPTLLVDSAASAVPLPITSRTSMATDKLVKTATNAKPELTHVTTKPSVPILMVDSHANVNPDSAETDTGVPKQQPKQHQLHPRQQQWLEHANHEAPTTVTAKPHVLITMTVHSLANKGSLIGNGIICQKPNKGTSGRPGTSSGGVKGSGEPNLKQANVQAHMQNFGSLKDKMFNAINRVMAGRSGKVQTFTARMKGIGRKALSRRRRKCPLDPDHKADAANALDNATSIEDVKNALIQVLVDRTSEIPPCRNIQQMIGRKVRKIASRMNGQTSA